MQLSLSLTRCHLSTRQSHFTRDGRFEHQLLCEKLFGAVAKVLRWKLLSIKPGSKFDARPVITVRPFSVALRPVQLSQLVQEALVLREVLLFV